VIKRSGKSLTKEYSDQKGINILEDVKNQNITHQGFFIEKADIEIFSQEGKERYLASIKYERPDKYLISIRSRSGIEGARIYLYGDSLKVNDRIHKKLFSGNALYLKRKYGIAPGLIPIIFGDLILDNNYTGKKDTCIGNRIKMRCNVKGVSLDYEIDCNRKKVALVKQSDNFNKNFINVSFSDFFNVGSHQISRLIEFEDTQYNIKVKIKVIKVELPWNGDIKFIPGKGYELIELL
jgi:hypothetical protein